MGYYKAIIYGNALELYSYEKDIRPTGGAKRSDQSRIVLPSVVEVEVVDVQRQVKKRQDSVNRAVLDFRRLVVANMVESVPPLLLTLTYAENQTDLGIAHKDFGSFIRNARVEFGKAFRYIAVPEFQKRGAVHFHVIVWGLPSNLSATERNTRMVASLWGRGFVDVIQTDGHDKISTYLSKYMSKSYVDFRLVGKKAYRASRNIIRPVVEKNLGGISFLSHAYPQFLDFAPCIDKQFTTKWLGKGRFRLYKTNP